ncbi:MAG: beta-ketoacyl synthase chain length factor, partial [Salinisphaeraceae bacterium]|nr:beta-ketoacyl synthase chain length factor [Salinisphaeraceae bacterium]
MTALTVFIDAVGLAAPGMNGWPQGRAVLSGGEQYTAEDLPRYAPELLPPNERRRATAIGRLAFQSAEEAISELNGEAADLAAVFASSGGDTDIVNLICTSLATPERPVSPTHFHNSVHNAAAGYWSIATGSRQPSTSLSAFDGSFGAGLMEAAVLCASEAQPVLLVAYDSVPKEPLHEKRPLTADFSAALILRPQAGAQTQASLSLNFCHDA